MASPALRTTRDYFDSLFEHSPIATVVIDDAGHARMCNPAFEALFQFSQEDVVDHELDALISPPDLHNEASLFSKNIFAGGTVCIETRRRKKDGSTFEVEVLGSPIRSHNKVVGAFALYRDLTAERANEELYRELFENANDIIFTIDLAGQFIAANRMAEVLTGYTREETIGKRNIFEMIAPEYVEMAREMLEKKQRENIRTTYELEVLRANGERLPIELSTRLVQRDGRAVGVQGIARDISDRKRLELQLRHSQKMEAIGRLAGGIAHDFNNLLMVIKGYTETLAESFAQTDPRSQQIEKVKRAADQAAALTKQLLAFSRKQILAPRVLNLNEVISDMTKLLPRVLREDIDIVFKADESIGSVLADRTQIEQVIMNLAINARDAMPEGGKLTIETASADLDEAYTAKHTAMAPGRHVMLAVSDTGIGMDEGTKAQIFEPFFTTKDAGKGTGLGLATVYGIVKQSGGSIWVYSEPGRGTTFKIYFPHIEEAPREESRVKKNFEVTTGVETVLLVEDQTDVREVAGMSLRQKGYIVLEAGTAEEALEVSRNFKGKIHLLLSDVVMPGMSGPALAEALRKERPQVEVIYMSGYTDRALEHRGSLPKNVPLLEKPFTLELLARKVREVLDHNENGKH